MPKSPLEIIQKAEELRNPDTLAEVVLDIEEDVEELEVEIEKIREIAETTRKEKGEKGDNGLKGDKGDKGERGEKGERGDKGDRGIDGKNGINGINGKNGLDGLNGIDGVNGKDGSPDTGEQIVDKINKQGKKIESSKLDLSKVEKDIKELKEKPAIINNIMGGQGGASGIRDIRAGTNISITKVNDVYTVNSTAISDTPSLQQVTDVGASTTVESTFSTGIVTPQLKASTSAGQTFKTNSGADWLHGGNGGSANATMYGGWNYDNATADTIASFGASKTLTSLSTTTYPSLTELSYVKGVTSAIQTQLDGKQASGTYVTGATNSTLTLTGTTLGLNLGNANTWTGQQTFNTSAAIFGVGVVTPKIYPSADSTNAVGIYKANGTSQILYTDTTNGRIGIGSAPTDYNLEVYSPVSVNTAMKIWTGGSIFGYTLGRNISTGFLDITGNQGIFSGIHVDQIKSDGAITIAGNAVISNWASTLGIGNGSGTPNGKIEIRTNDNTVPNLAMGGGSGTNYNFRRDTGTGYLHIDGQQGQFTGYRFSTGNYTDVFTMIDGVGAVFNETGESVLDFRIESDTDANNFFVDASANANGFGTNTPSAKVHIIKTTEQLRVGYDASNYWSTTVGSTGGVTFDAVGSGASFTFSDNIRLTQTVTTEAVTSDTTVTININGTDYKLLAKA